MKKIKNKLQEEKGITLIALVITIIVLIILAGISIQLLLGENGIITKAKKGKGDYQEASVREKVEMALVDYNSDKITNGEDGKVEEALNKLLDNETFEDIEIEENIGVIDDYEVTLSKEKGEIIIESIDKVTGSLRLRCKLSTREYTNETITINVKATGNITKVIKPDNTETTPINGKVEIDYPVNENGTYTFKAEDTEGNSVEKEVVVNNIDTLPPKDFSITVEEANKKLIIIGNTEDEEETETSACSGIDKYEYFVKKPSEVEYPQMPYTTNEIEITEYGNYIVKVIAYDKVGNRKESTEITIKVNVKFDKVSVGSNHILAIDTEGNLWAGGSNSYGQLGDGTKIDRVTPIQITTEKKFKEIVAGDYHSLAIDKEGKLWSWGRNQKGQLGNNTTTDSNNLIRVQVEDSISFKAIAAGIINSMAIDENGTLWTWGDNSHGQLGNGTTSLGKVPVKIKEETKFKKVVLPLGITEVQCLAIDEENNLWGWGNNAWGQVGDGTKTTRTSPTLVKSGTKFNEVGAGFWGSMAQTTEGELWSWGYSGNNGQLADSTNQIRPNPWKNPTWKKLNSFTTRYQYGGGIDEEGNLWLWGTNGSGQIGDGTKTTRKEQTLIRTDVKFKEMSTGSQASAAIDREGNLWTWGYILNKTVLIPTKVF